MFSSYNPVLGLRLELLCFVWQTKYFLLSCFPEHFEACVQSQREGASSLVPQVLEEMVLTPSGCENVESSFAPCLRSELILLRRAGWVEVASGTGSPSTIIQAESGEMKSFPFKKAVRTVKRETKQKRANLGVVSGYKAGQNKKFCFLTKTCSDSYVQVKHKRKEFRNFYLMSFLRFR